MKKETKQALVELFDACHAADCNCTVKERESGHKTECWKPDFEDVLRNAEEAVVNEEAS
jgi:hypothetical protein